MKNEPIESKKQYKTVASLVIFAIFYILLALAAWVAASVTCTGGGD